eukprot:GDKJ01023330.1.p1 GENE.GDKJ01023330.1~~GDKJ01023330.1.p1  ORF type:complete len:386 (-),score=93.64 GDKJ01023330.1:76-1233(-)
MTEAVLHCFTSSKNKSNAMCYLENSNPRTCAVQLIARMMGCPWQWRPCSMSSLDSIGSLPVVMCNGTSISSPLVFEAARELTGSIYGDIVADSAYIGAAEVYLNGLSSYLQYNVKWSASLFAVLPNLVKSSRAPISLSLFDFFSERLSFRSSSSIPLPILLSKCSSILTHLSSLPEGLLFAGGDRPSVGDCSMAAAIKCLISRFRSLNVSLEQFSASKDEEMQDKYVLSVCEFLFSSEHNKDKILKTHLKNILKSIVVLESRFVSAVEDASVVLAGDEEQTVLLRVVSPSLSAEERNQKITMLNKTKRKVLISPVWPMSTDSQKLKSMMEEEENENRNFMKVSRRRKFIMYGLYLLIGGWTAISLLQTIGEAAVEAAGEEDENNI